MLNNQKKKLKILAVADEQETESGQIIGRIFQWKHFIFLVFFSNFTIH